MASEELCFQSPVICYELPDPRRKRSLDAEKAYIHKIIEKRVDYLGELILDAQRMRDSFAPLFDEECFKSKVGACLFSIQFFDGNQIAYYNNLTHPWISVNQASTPEAFLRSFARSVLSDDNLKRFSPATLFALPVNNYDPYIAIESKSRLSQVYAPPIYDLLFSYEDEQPISAMSYRRRFYVLSFEDRERNQVLEFFVFLETLSRRPFLQTFVRIEESFSSALERFMIDDRFPGETHPEVDCFSRNSSQPSLHTTCRFDVDRVDDPSEPFLLDLESSAPALTRCLDSDGEGDCEKTSLRRRRHRFPNSLTSSIGEHSRISNPLEIDVVICPQTLSPTPHSCSNSTISPSWVKAH